jgi:hypothetical protein
MIYESFDYPIFALNPIDSLSTAAYNQVMTVREMFQHINKPFYWRHSLKYHVAYLQDVQYNSQQNYQNYPLRAVDFSLFMWAAVNSETCLRRGWCNPVGGSSVYSTVSQNMTSTDGKPIIIVSATMDSRSIFHDLTLGVENDVSGMVALFAVADALSKVKNNFGICRTTVQIFDTLFLSSLQLLSIHFPNTLSIQSLMLNLGDSQGRKDSLMISVHRLYARIQQPVQTIALCKALAITHVYRIQISRKSILITSKQW